MSVIEKIETEVLLHDNSVTLNNNECKDLIMECDTIIQERIDAERKARESAKKVDELKQDLLMLIATASDLSMFREGTSRYKQAEFTLVGLEHKYSDELN